MSTNALKYTRCHTSIKVKYTMLQNKKDGSSFPRAFLIVFQISLVFDWHNILFYTFIYHILL